MVLASALATAAPETPPAPSRWLTDTAGVLSPAAARAVDGYLEAYARQTSHQVLVWIAPTIGEASVEDFAVRAFEAWRLGRKGIDDGLVLFVFPEDRLMRIEVGYGLEDRVPDAIASRIIREVIAPRLQAGEPDGAIRDGVVAIVAAIEGKTWAPPATSEGAPPRRSVERRGPSLGQMVLYGVLGVGFLFLLATNPTLAIFLLLSVLGGGGRGGGGGGGFSGGGGRSGGGGATGSW